MTLLKVIPKILIGIMLVGLLTVSAGVVVQEVESQSQVKIYRISGVAIPFGLTVDGRLIDADTTNTSVHRNTPLLVDHGRSIDNIVGKVTRLFRSQGVLKFEAEIYVTDEKVAALVKKILIGEIRGISIGIVGTVIPIKRFPTDDSPLLVSVDNTVLEISIVNVPAYSNAEIESITLKE